MGVFKRHVGCIGCKGASRLRILVVDLSVYPFFAGFVSGGDRHKLEICKRFGSHGHVISVMTTETGAKILKWGGVDVRTYIISVPFEELLCRTIIGLVILYIIRVAKSIPLILRLREEFQLVCTFSHFLVNVLPAVMISKRNSHSKLVVYIHHLEPKPLRRAVYHPFLPNIFMWISQSASLMLMREDADLVFVNPHDAKWITRLGIPREKVRAMRQGVDVERIHRTDGGEEKYDACFLGRLSPFKVFDLTDVWGAVCQIYPKAQLVIIGTELEKYVSQLRGKIEVSGLVGNIKLLGVLSEDEKYAVLKSCKIFVFPSYEEGWGIAVCEAMACGLPVVAYDLVAYDVFGDAIIRVPTGNVKALSDTISKLLSNEELRTKMSRKARFVSSQFDWEKIAKEELKMINLFMKRKPGKMSAPDSEDDSNFNSASLYAKNKIQPQQLQNEGG